MIVPPSLVAPFFLHPTLHSFFIKFPLHPTWQEGALLARLWNLQTGLMDSELGALKKEAVAWAADVRVLKDQVRCPRARTDGPEQPQMSWRCTFPSSPPPVQVRRLNPLIDWEREAQARIETLTDELESTTNSLALARR